MKTEKELYRKGIKDTLWLIVLQGVSYLVPLFVWPYLMVVLGAEGFGKIGFSISLCQFLVLVIDYGFNITATRAIALSNSKEERSKIAVDVLSAKGLLLFLSLIAVVIVSFIPQYHIYRKTLYAMMGMVIGSTFTLQWLFQGVEKIRIVGIVNAICRVLILPLTFLCVKNSSDAVIAASIQGSTYLLSGIVMLCICQYQGIIAYSKPTLLGIKETLKEGFPIFISTAMSSVYAMLLSVVLGYCTSVDEVGRYTAVEKMMRLGCYTLLMPLLQAFYPRISRLSVTEPIAAKKMVKTILCGLCACMTLLGIVLFLGGEKIGGFLGSDYEGTAAIFRIMAFIPVLIAISGVEGQLGLMAIGKENSKQLFGRVYAIGCCAAIVLTLTTWHAMSALWASKILLLTEGIVAVGMVWAYHKK